MDRSARRDAWAVVPLVVIIGSVVLWYVRSDHLDATAHFEFITVQAALIAGVVLATSAYHRRRWGIMAIALVVATALLGFQYLFGLPLSLYACVEWLEAARAAGTSNGW